LHDNIIHNNINLSRLQYEKNNQVVIVW